MSQNILYFSYYFLTCFFEICSPTFSCFSHFGTFQYFHKRYFYSVFMQYLFIFEVKLKPIRKRNKQLFHSTLTIIYQLFETLLYLYRCRLTYCLWCVFQTVSSISFREKVKGYLMPYCFTLLQKSNQRIENRAIERETKEEKKIKKNYQDKKKKKKIPQKYQ